ncbi:MAG: DUF3536 domain-containing protein [Elusimicrobiaceae bacterium]|nr:DUF3536 domain-containing protein [Elusimicrobiaceae bacterium]
MNAKAQTHGKKYVVIHGHFYQPPRENPWLGYVEEQTSAAPAHDWNERIAEECYNPNGTARINAPDGTIEGVTNNYEFMNFDFGPTLLSWYEKAFPEDYRRVIEGHKKSAQRLGCGNGIAHAYNHTILPITPFRDRLTQVLWGLEDFRHRFGEQPAAMWCPETACNDDTLKLLVDQRMQYVILDVSQALRTRKAGAARWIDVSNGTIDPRRPYIWHDRDEATGAPLPGRSIAVFFYDGPVSKAVAFEDAMKDSHTLCQRLGSCFDTSPAEDQLVSVATDGESYGHHRKFADLTLAHLFTAALKKHGYEVTNYSAYLKSHPPQWEVQLKPGEGGEGTSWSCCHGVTRWKGDCSCGQEGNNQHRWRAPLRAALDWLSVTLAGVYETESARYLRNPWQARNDYIRVILDPGNLQWFINTHFAAQPDQESVSAVLRLLEMQKYAMFMFTSCGWFFSDISRIESAQNLKYAVRAIDLAARFGYDSLEAQFRVRLKAAPSNYSRFEDGAAVYDKLAKPSLMKGENIIAEFGIRTLYRNPGRNSGLYSYRFSREKSVFRQLDGGTFSAGLLGTENVVTGRRMPAVYFATVTSSLAPRCYVSVTETEAKFNELFGFLEHLDAERIWDGIGPAVERIMGREHYGMKDLIPEARRAVLEDMYRGKISDIQDRHFRTFGDYLPIIEHWHSLELGLPDEIQADAIAGTRKFVTAKLEEFALTGDCAGIDMLRSLLPRIRKTGLDYMDSRIERLFKVLILNALAKLRKQPSAASAETALLLVETGFESGASNWLVQAQNAGIKMLEDWQAGQFAALKDPSGSCDYGASLLHLLAKLKIGIVTYHTAISALKSAHRKML